MLDADLGAARKRLDALRGTDECRHHEDADRKQHGLQDVRAGVVEPEQDRKRPAAGKRRAEHLGADQDRRAITVMTVGQTIWRRLVGEGCELMGLYPVSGAISPKSAPLSSAKGPKKPHRVI